jgi:hypothetical protein
VVNAADKLMYKLVQDRAAGRLAGSAYVIVGGFARVELYATRKDGDGVNLIDS